MSTLNRFTYVIQQPEVDLPRAALLFARGIAYPQLDIDDGVGQLEDLAKRAAALLPAAGTPVQQAEALGPILFHRLGLTGNRTQYDDPRNSFLNEVLIRELGIPISLSVVYLSVAQQLGIPAFGVGLPGHFVVGASARRQTIYLDPFNYGQRLTRDECGELVRRTLGFTGTLRDEWFEPTPSTDIVYRMLNNLRMIYLRGEQWEDALTVLRYMAAIRPNAAHIIRDRGIIYYQQRDLVRAMRAFEAYLEQAPDAPDAETIREQLAPLVEQWARAN